MFGHSHGCEFAHALGYRDGESLTRHSHDIGPGGECGGWFITPLRSGEVAAWMDCREPKPVLFPDWESAAEAILANALAVYRLCTEEPITVARCRDAAGRMIGFAFTSGSETVAFGEVA